MPMINVILCKDCKHFRAFPEEPYGLCTRLPKTALIVKSNDYCSSADYPLPEYDDHNVSGLLDD